MKNLLGLLSVLVALFVQACGGSSPGPNIRDLTIQEQSLVQSSNLFGFKLFHEVVLQSDGGNVFLSPLSVSLALGMTYNGARGSTEEGMRSTLEFGDLNLAEVNQGYRDLIDLLTRLDPKVAMEIANSIWYRAGFQVLQEFIDLNRTFFDALVSALDFADPAAADTINAWVSQKTHGKISEIVASPIDAATVMFLINAIYFKGTWTYQFDPQDTQAAGFTTAFGEQKTVLLMTLHGDLPYLETTDFQAVDLPYGSKLFGMAVFLPKPGKTIDQLVADLTDENWSIWMGAFNQTEGDLYLPRFELELELSLNDVLDALGMGVAFLPGQADFSGIAAAYELFISNVKHKTYVKVDEEGTEAAAVTSVEVGTTSLPETFVMRADRPFVFVIHDRHSRALLFMGKMVDPPSE